MSMGVIGIAACFVANSRLNLITSLSSSELSDVENLPSAVLSHLSSQQKPLRARLTSTLYSSHYGHVVTKSVSLRCESISGYE